MKHLLLKRNVAVTALLSTAIEIGNHEGRINKKGQTPLRMD